MDNSRTIVYTKDSRKGNGDIGKEAHPVTLLDKSRLTTR